MSFLSPCLRSHYPATAGNLLVRLLLGGVLLTLAVLPAQAQQPKEILVIAISNDFQPFTFVNAQGEPAGMFVDMWRFWGEKNHQKIEFLVSDWKTSLDNLQSGKADIHSGLIYSQQRSLWMTAVHAFYRADVCFFTLRRQDRIDNIEQLAGETVAVLTGSAPEEFLKNQYPQIRLLSVVKQDDQFKVTRQGQAMGFFMVAATGSALIDRYGLTGDFNKSDFILYQEDFHPGVLKEKTELAAYVDQGMNAITDDEWAEIEARWISARPNWTEIRKWTLIIGGGVAIVLGLTLYWIRRLRREVARQTQIEAELEKSQSLLNETGKIAKVGGWDFDAETSELGWTDEVYRIHEVEKIHISTLNEAIEFYTPASRRIVTSAFQRSIDFGEPFDLELEIVTVTGIHRWVHSIGKAKQEEGKTRRVFGTFQDITEHKKLKDTLLLNHEQLQLVLQGGQLGFWDWNIVTGKVERNERWAEMLGYTLAEVELSVKQWTDLIHPDDRERAWKSIQDHLEGRTPGHAIEYRMRHKDGHFRWILDQARIVERDADNQPQRMTGTHTDITDRKLTEQNRIRAQVESEERSRIARELHDGSGQSLQAIRLHLQLLAAGKGSGDLKVELGELARSVAETASELRDMSHQLRPSYLQDVTLDAALRDRCNLLNRRGVPVSLDSAGDFSVLPDQVSDNFYRVFQEAVTNAVRHASARGINIDLTRSGSRLTLSVSDDGPGIDERTSGHGLGLQIMQERATLIGATLTISSNASGTSVTLTQENV